MIKVRELKGFKSLRAVNTFHTLLMGLKMLPQFLGESYEAFFLRIKKMDDDGRRTMFVQAVNFVPLTDEEIEAVIYFTTDGNGVAFTSENLKGITPTRMREAIVAVCLEICRIEGSDLLTDAEKKN